jgi:hypothetical protein
MTFEAWADKNNLSEYGKACSRAAWQAAQEAERERTTAIMLKYIHDDNYAKWNEAIKTAMRAINDN